MTFSDAHAFLDAARGFILGMRWYEALGYLGAGLSIAASSMRTMIPLRSLALATNVVMLTYAVLAGVYPAVIVNLVLLPLNAMRLHQMLRLVREVNRAASCDLSMDWLKPYMRSRPVRRGEVLFAKGDPADCLYGALKGRLVLKETGIEILPGQIVGEMGLLSPGNARTGTLEALDDGEVLVMSYGSLRELYHQNPEFGFAFLRLTSGRMFENLARLERELAAARAGAEAEERQEPGRAA